MAYDSGETLNSDPVMSIYKAFANSSGLNILTRLEICERAKIAQNISFCALDFAAKIIIFPVEIGVQTFPIGWQQNVCQELFKVARCTVGVLGDRDYQGSLPRGSLSTYYLPLYSPRVLLVYCNTLDDPESLSIFKAMVCKNETVTFEMLVLNIAGEESSTSEFLGNIEDDIKLTFLTTDSEKWSDRIIRTLEEYGSEDLVILGYSTLTSNVKFRDYIYGECKSSFLLVHGSSACNNRPKFLSG